LNEAVENLGPGENHVFNNSSNVKRTGSCHTLSSISIQVANIAYPVFQWAPLQYSTPYDNFRSQVDEEVESEDRYQPALACYHDIHSKSDPNAEDGQHVRNILNENDRTQIEDACGNGK